MARVANHFYQGLPPAGEYRFFQIAFVVDDLIEAARTWVELYGVGPFHVLPRRTLPFVYRGQSSPVDMQLAITQAGPVQLELIQQFGDAPSVYREFARQGQAGVHHMCTISERYEATLQRYEDLGFPVVAEVKGQVRAAYVDTHAKTGFLSEVVESSSGFIANLAAIAETCAAWDGKDPIRLLHRDGYRVPDPA